MASVARDLVNRLGEVDPDFAGCPDVVRALERRLLMLRASFRQKEDRR
jgi:hypothetical protein